ncbi:MAG: acyltransferase [bacterium]
MDNSQNVKAKGLMQDTRKSAFRKYRDLFYGDRSLCFILWAEFVFFMFSGTPGAAGLFLRRLFYPGLFQSCGKKTVFGQFITFRHPHKISLGSGVLLDDNCMLDAKGESNKGIVIEDSVFIGRNSIVYCKNGNIHLKHGVNISSNCTLFSSNSLTMEEGTLVGAYSYLLSGGEYETNSSTRFADQSGAESAGPLVIGPNSWIGANVTILDGASIGEHCVIGAGAVVTKPIPANSLAVGVPARVSRTTQAPTPSSDQR